MQQPRITASPERAIAMLGGIGTLRELERFGVWRELVTICLMYGTLFRVRHGWYAAPGEHPDVVRAWRVGGRLACRSTLQLLTGEGGDGMLHVQVPSNAARLRHPDDRRRRLDTGDGVIVHWDGLVGDALRGERRSVGLDVAREQASVCGVDYRRRQGSSP